MNLLSKFPTTPPNTGCFQCLGVALHVRPFLLPDKGYSQGYFPDFHSQVGFPLPTRSRAHLSAVSAVAPAADWCHTSFRTICKQTQRFLPVIGRRSSPRGHRSLLKEWQCNHGTVQYTWDFRVVLHTVSWWAGAQVAPVAGRQPFLSEAVTWRTPRSDG